MSRLNGQKKILIQQLFTNSECDDKDCIASTSNASLVVENSAVVQEGFNLDSLSSDEKTSFRLDLIWRMLWIINTKLKENPETIPKPSTNQLLRVGIHNSVPFIGFGFLDNFFMLICGDYIEMYVGSIIALSTMAAAALGNTLSDILGIGSAFYVERAVTKVGLRPPNLSPIQLDMFPTRTAANLGRVIGVTIGCLLGMFPLLFTKKEKKDEKDKKNKDVEIIPPLDSITKEFSSGQQGTSISVV